jgi:hypothetical protein
MKITKKLIAMLLCLVLSMSMLAGCGTSDSDADNGEAKEAGQTASTPKNIFDSIAGIMDMEGGNATAEVTIGGSQVASTLQQYVGSDSLKLQIEAKTSEDEKSGVVTVGVELDGTMTDAIEVMITDGTAYVNVSKLLDVASTIAAKIDEDTASQVELMKSVFTQEYIGITSDDLTQLIGEEVDLSDLSSLYSIAGVEASENSELSEILSDEEKVQQYITLAVEVMGDKTAEALTSVLSQDGTTSKIHLGSDNYEEADAQIVAYAKDVLPGLLEDYAAKLKESLGESDALYKELSENLEDIKSELTENIKESEDEAEEINGTIDMTYDVTGNQGSRVVTMTAALASDEVTLDVTIKSTEGQYATVTAPEEYMNFSDLSALLGLGSDDTTDYDYSEETY